MSIMDPLSFTAQEPLCYTNPAPHWYRCSDCGVTGCKLWRPANMDYLRCCDCAANAQSAPDGKLIASVKQIDSRGRIKCAGMAARTDNIGWLVPAVPCEDGESYWGYTSVPQAGVEWWRALPTRVKR